MSESDTETQAIRQKNERELDKIHLYLEDVFGKGNFPLSIVGDLHDFKDTLLVIHNFCEEIFFSTSEKSTEDAITNLYSLELQIEDDLGWIIADLLPALKQLNRRIRDID